MIVAVAGMEFPVVYIIHMTVELTFLTRFVASIDPTYSRALSR